MNQGRMIFRVVLMAVASALLFYRGMQRNDGFLKGLGGALAAGAVVAAVRLVMELKKQQRLQSESQTKASTAEKVELFTKPKDL